MGYVKWSYQVLEKFCYDAFRAFGFSDEESKDIEDVLLMADLYGIESHGMQRMVRYHKGIEKGTIHPQAKPEVVFETPVSAVIDGHNGMGQLISIFAMKILNFRLACFGDPAAWIAAAVFTGISYLYVMRKIEQSHPA